MKTKLSSSPALQLSSSPALQLSSVKRFAGLLLALLIVLCVVFGLSAAQTASKNSTIEQAKAIDVIDAGIVFSDQPHYVCILLSRLGISGSTDVRSIRSSCDCTRASVVAIRESATRSLEALRIDFLQEDSSENTTSLQVEFTINTTNGDSRTFSVRFVAARSVKSSETER